jgi:hypothetical protein
MPTSIRTVSGLSYLTIVLSITMALAFSKHRPSVRDALIAITLLALGWSASRVSLMISVLLVPILAQSFRDTPLYALAFAENKSQSEGALKPWQMMFILGLATLGSAFAGAHDTAFAKKVNDNFPVAETAFMQEHGITGRIMNTIEAGGYLIAKLQRPVFLDTRLDLYGDDFYFAFMAANGGQGNWRAFMDKWQPDVVLLEHTASLKTLLIESGTYRPVFNGLAMRCLLKADSILKCRPSPNNAKLPSTKSTRPRYSSISTISTTKHTIRRS